MPVPSATNRIVVNDPGALGLRDLAILEHAEIEAPGADAGEHRVRGQVLVDLQPLDQHRIRVPIVVEALVHYALVGEVDHLVVVVNLVVDISYGYCNPKVRSS